MIPKDCKRLAEVDFPIAAVSAHAVREKSIRHGHPSTLHLWWARRPLAACRAMLLALLLPDPGEPLCPADFKAKARELLAKTQGRVGPKDADLRTALLAFIASFANWDNAANPTFLEVGRGLVRAAHGDEAPLVVDPFAGGGSIPLEALRLGCDAFASDLNPVACLILKVLLEDIPRHGPALAEELRRVGAEVKKAAKKELAAFYPADPDGARPIAYLWARTVRCEAPHCGAEIPLMRSFWLGRKGSRSRALRTKVLRPAKSVPAVEFDVFEPLTEAEVRGGTVSRAKALCVCCNTVLAPDRVRTQLAAQRGGADVVFDAKGRRTGGARLLAVVTLREGDPGRHYRQPTDADYRAVWKAQQRLKEVAATKGADGLTLIPDEAIPRTELRRIAVPIYGIEMFRHMFSSRQLVSLSKLAELIRATGGSNSASAAHRLLALCLGKTADLNNGLSRWEPKAECPRQTLARHDIPMAWDFAEAVPIGESSGSFNTIVKGTASAIPASCVSALAGGTTQTADACAYPLPTGSTGVWFTDPPYYDAVPYAHLSDFFFIWHKRALPHVQGAGHGGLTPKAQECVVDRPHRLVPDAKTAIHFEARIALAMKEGVRVTRDDGIASVVFAHKTTEGWEALLGGMIDAGWVITASWPIATEMQSRLNARENASLATSVHLVCRPRTEDRVGDWAEVYRALPKRVGEWMVRLEGEGVRGADLVFACIGPALEIYSRYAKVVDAEEREIPLGGDPEAKEPHRRGYLAYVWEAVGRAALQEVLGSAEAKARNGAAGALEEDARLTALFLWTLQSAPAPAGSAEENADEVDAEADDEEDGSAGGRKKKGYTLVFDVVRRFAQPLGIHLPEWEGRILETKKGVVRLLPVLERARQLFGDAGAEAAAERMERPTGPVQRALFPDMDLPQSPPVRGRARRGARPAGGTAPSPASRREPTTLDRVHAAMLLQAGGKAHALRALLQDEQQRGPDFLRLANALSALYPRDSEEKRLLDAMLLAAPR